MGATIESYRDLQAWKHAITLTKLVYRVSSGFPADERFGLTTQIRRAAISVPSNIAEGWGRGTTTDYARFLRMARGSLYEVETQCVIAYELGMIEPLAMEECNGSVGETGRVLAGLIRSIERKIESGS